jgi:hypothetical protein
MRKLIVGAVLFALVPLQAVALTTDDLLALVAMPLAVAAVSDLTGVPEAALASLAATLNNADVPPVQFVEVIRYVPVALVVEDDQPDFVQFVQTQTAQGIRGPALVTVIEQRLRTIEPAIVFQPQPLAQTVFVTETFIPPIVRTRIAARRVHPHGGPPGQLKKQRGLQTGAEVVHGTKPVVRPMISGSPERGRGKDKAKGKERGEGGGGGKGKSEGKGKGKGKG